MVINIPDDDPSIVVPFLQSFPVTTYNLPKPTSVTATSSTTVSVNTAGVHLVVLSAEIQKASDENIVIALQADGEVLFPFMVFVQPEFGGGQVELSLSVSYPYFFTAGQQLQLVNISKNDLTARRGTAFSIIYLHP
jgi:hypothetical protein